MPTAVTSTAPTTYQPSAEFAQQAKTWADLGYPVSDATLQSLQGFLAQLSPVEPTRECVPFVLVVPSAARPATEAMARIALRGKPGTVNQHAGDIDEFTAAPGFEVPATAAYLLVDVERGSEFCGTPPEAAEAVLADRGRTPLTVAEGIALVTLHPEVLEKNHCFSLAGSRKGDRRVPALWISKGAPHLGWCFAGVPHSWLGLASAGDRHT
jgi:hypothetical protein